MDYKLNDCQSDSTILSILSGHLLITQSTKSPAVLLRAIE